MKLLTALSNPHQIGSLVEVDEEGKITVTRTIICDGTLAAMKVGKSWREVSA